MALYSTYDQVGQKEDVSDVISNISPTETPFVTMIGRGKADARLFEWQEDTLAAPKANAAVEGADATDETLTPTTMRANYTQIIEGCFKVSGTADAIATYGRDKESAYQLAKKGKELKRDLEYNLVGIAQDAAVGDATSAPRKFGNVFGKDASSTPADLIHTDHVFHNSDTGRALTETLLLSSHQTLFSAGADPTVWMVPPKHALTIAQFAQASGRGIERDLGGGRKITNVVDVYESPYGTLRVVMNRWMYWEDLATDIFHNLLLDPDMWALATLRPWQRELLAKTGDNKKYQLLTEVSLKHRNFKGDGWISDLL